MRNRVSAADLAKVRAELRELRRLLRVAIGKVEACNRLSVAIDKLTAMQLHLELLAKVIQTQRKVIQRQRRIGRKVGILR